MTNSTTQMPEVLYKGSFPWTRAFPEEEKPAAIQRWQRTQNRHFDYVVENNKNGQIQRSIVPGYRSKLRTLANAHKDRRCFLLGNGPSLRQMNLAPLRNEITIGSNGVFRMFPEWGFHTTYFTMEDVAQVEDRRHELPNVVGPVRIFGIDNSYCVDERDDTFFANVIRNSHPFDNVWWKDHYPGFSQDFSSAVFLGSTVSYLNLQLAYFLGCNPVYIIGIDHDYGPLQKMFPPGKIEITPEVLELLQKVHCIKGYHKVGGRIGIPYVAEQEQAFRKANEYFNNNGRNVFNAGKSSNLDIFPRANFSDLF